MREPQIHNEKELLLRIARSDDQAFAELFEQTLEYFTNYIFRLTKSAETAEEIAHDVFLKLWTHRETLVGIQRIIPFLMVVSRNQAYMALRKKFSEEKKLSHYQADIAQASLVEDMEDDYLSALDEAINQLSPRVREVYLMSRQQRLTYQQVAESLGISKETVKTHLEKATHSITRFLKIRYPDLGAMMGLGFYDVIRNFL